MLDRVEDFNTMMNSEGINPHVDSIDDDEN